jgi:hypothetical protein
MFLMSRRRLIRPGDERAGAAAALEAAGRVKQISGLDIGVWMTAMSPQSGMVGWTAQVEHLSEVETATDKLAADSGYMDWLTSIDSHFVGPLIDGALQVVSGEPSGSDPAYAMVTTSVCANGAIAAAMAGGAEAAAAVTRITGNAALFCSAVTGNYGGVAWVIGFPDLDAVESSLAALASDPDWLALVDRVGPSFGPNPEATLWRRLV